MLNSCIVMFDFQVRNENCWYFVLVAVTIQKPNEAKATKKMPTIIRRLLLRREELSTNGKHRVWQWHPTRNRKYFSGPFFFHFFFHSFELI